MKIALTAGRAEKQWRSVGLSTPSIQTDVVSKYHPHENKPGLLGEVADSRAGAGTVQDKPGMSP